MIAFVTGGSGFLGGRLIRALQAHGDSVRALARSERAIRVLEPLGVEIVRGDLDDRGALDSGARGCRAIFHCAAKADEWGRPDDFVATNVTGTLNVSRAARKAGARLVHVSTEAVMAGRPIIDVDEVAPPPAVPVGLYARTKRDAELVIARGLGEGLDAVICRPRLLWGKGDTSLLPKLVARVKAGQFAWVGGGRHLTSTCHVDNAVAGLLAAFERGKKGETYYFTDGPPTEFRAFVTALLDAVGAPIPTKSVPFWLANAAAIQSEWAWRTFGRKGAPPVTRMAVLLTGLEVTVIDSKARREIGYVPPMTVERGFAELRGEA